ncbi:MMPL family transporter [Niveibacterium sp. SC-1]|uniref:MMPL family transporter n=1 Tax=Niveibacterium sp. SC-1 TaxID=3135646 RepID=UPI00311F239C
MTEVAMRAGARNSWRLAALLWLFVVLAAMAHNAWVWGVQRPALDADIMALLPRDARDPVAEAAFTRMAANAERRVVVLIGAPTVEGARRAADRYLADIQGIAADVRHTVDGRDFAAWRDFLAPYRGVLIGEQGRALLQMSVQQRSDYALSRLFSPASGGGLSWPDDPFGLFASWMMEQAAGQNVRPLDGRLWISTPGREWAVVLIGLHDGAFSSAAQDKVLPRLDKAAAALRADPQLSVRTAGIAPVAAVVARSAQSEMSAIGLGSVLGIILLVFLVFRRASVLLLVLLPILVGTLCASSVVLWVFGSIHALTLVFGASLVGVAVDYGLLYLCSGVGEQPFDPFARRRRLFAGLLLALVTVVCAYAGLALAPFPGLRQMSLFAACGLLAAWSTVLLWYPWLARANPHGEWLASALGRARAAWPAFGRGRIGGALAAIVALVAVSGIARLHVQDDVRALQSVPLPLLLEQAEVAKLAGVPSPAQFFVVRGASPEETLQREEALGASLSALVAEGTLEGFQAVSRRIPSRARQQADCAALRGLYEDAQWQAAMSEASGLDAARFAQRLRCDPLDFAAWLANPVSEPFRPLWLGQVGDAHASVTMLSGLQGPAVVARLQSLAGQLPGVSWVDKPATISEVLQRYRSRMLWVVGGAYVLALLLMLLRYGREAWRPLAPPLAGSLLALGVLGWSGLPFQLFAVLGLFLVLGMGVDYGVFLIEQPRRGDGATWLAVSMAALMSILSFGLLALSHMPALRVFGLTTLVGIAGAWLLAPSFSRRDSA